MLKSLVWKEFREVLPVCAIAMAAQLLLFGYAVNVWRIHQPRDAYDIWPLLYLNAVLMGVALGIWQNVRDDNQGTFQFLLHRPIKRSTIFTVRLLLGAAVCLIVGLLPLVFFTIWVEGINPNRETPISEVIYALCAGIWLLYTGAFLSVLRPGRWYGSRFLPLFAGIFLFILIQIFFSTALDILHIPDANETTRRLIAWLLLRWTPKTGQDDKV
jgi:ABC-type transport system involved in multi-copper enzyme maturation permease subunit